MMPQHARMGSSPVWKVICNNWTDLLDGLGWSIRSGDVNFLVDNWVIGQGRLINHTSKPLPSFLMNGTVADFVDNAGEWDIGILWELVEQWKPADSIQDWILSNMTSMCISSQVAGHLSLLLQLILFGGKGMQECLKRVIT